MYHVNKSNFFLKLYAFYEYTHIHKYIFSNVSATTSNRYCPQKLIFINKCFESHLRIE